MIIVSGVAQAGTGTLVFIILMICEAGFWMATWEEFVFSFCDIYLVINLSFFLFFS